MAELLAFAYDIYSTAETVYAVAIDSIEVADSIYEKIKRLLTATQSDLGYMYYPTSARYEVNVIHFIKYSQISRLISTLLIRDPTTRPGSSSISNDIEIVLNAAVTLRNLRFPSGDLYYNTDDQEFRLSLNDLLRLLGHNYDRDLYTHALANLIRVTSINQFASTASQRIFDRLSFERHFEINWESHADSSYSVELDDL